MKINLYMRLRKYESYLNTAHKADYIRGLTTTQLNELIEVGNELGIHYKYNHCPKCVLDFIKKLAVPYFAHQEKAAEKASKQAKNAVIEEEVDHAANENG